MPIRPAPTSLRQNLYLDFYCWKRKWCRLRPYLRQSSPEKLAKEQWSRSSITSNGIPGTRSSRKSNQGRQGDNSGEKKRRIWGGSFACNDTTSQVNETIPTKNTLTPLSRFRCRCLLPAPVPHSRGGLSSETWTQKRLDPSVPRRIRYPALSHRANR